MQLDGLQPSLASSHPCWGDAPLPPAPLPALAPLLPQTRDGEGAAAAGRSPYQPGGWCGGPPASCTCSEGFIPFIYSSNKKWDVYTLSSWEPKQNIVFCTGGSYLWLVAKADNASSRDLPALCNKAIAHYRLIGISSGQLNQGAGCFQSSAAEPRAECSPWGLCWGRRVLGFLLPRMGISSPRLSKRWSQAKTIGLNSLVNSISLASQIRTLSEMGKRSRAAIVPQERAKRAL